jgi:hypothetical protein
LTPVIVVRPLVPQPSKCECASGLDCVSFSGLGPDLCLHAIAPCPCAPTPTGSTFLQGYLDERTANARWGERPKIRLSARSKDPIRSHRQPVALTLPGKDIAPLTSQASGARSKESGYVVCRAFWIRRRGSFLLGPGMLIAFETGEPRGVRGNTHFGFQVDDLESVRRWADHFGTSVESEPSYAATKVRDGRQLLRDIL